MIKVHHRRACTLAKVHFFPFTLYFPPFFIVVVLEEVGSTNACGLLSMFNLAFYGERLSDAINGRFVPYTLSGCWCWISLLFTIVRFFFLPPGFSVRTDLYPAR
jgi:hypothetical protein